MFSFEYEVLPSGYFEGGMKVCEREGKLWYLFRKSLYFIIKNFKKIRYGIGSKENLRYAMGMVLQGGR